MKWKIVIGTLAVVLIFVGITFLIPEEEELPVSPTIYEYESATYDMVEVKVGDVINSTNITFRYNATSVEKLYFQLEGYEISEIYVNEGDTVQKGDLLAILNMEDLEDDLLDSQNTIANLNLKLSQLQEQYDIQYQNQVDYLATLSDQQLEYAQTPEEKVVSYLNQIEEIQDELLIQELKLEQIQEKVEQRKVFATMDGTVSFAKEYEEKEISNKTSTVVEILDTQTSVFMATTEYENMLEVNQKVDIEIDDEIYVAVVVSSQDYALYDEDLEEDEYRYYLQLEEQTISLTDGDSGKVNVILEQALDVLYLPEDAIGDSKGEDVVYYINDEGFRDVIYIETALIADGNVQIISGLTEGQMVILD